MQPEQKPFAELAPLDPWSGSLAPKIRPEPIPKIWVHDKDPNRRRATFGVSYPLWEITIGNSAELEAKLPARSEKNGRRAMKGVRFYFRVPGFIKDTDFSECKFHRPDERNEAGASKLKAVSFRNCSFNLCIFGGTPFQHVTFQQCSFSRSDFEGAKFNECQFVECTFVDCTAESASFFATEINPTDLLNGTPPPIYNYTNEVPSWEASPSQIVTEWIEVRRKVAAQLLRSNTEAHKSHFADEALFELKRAELKARLEKLRILPLKECLVWLPFLSSWLVLQLTKGGTSLSRLMVSGIFFMTFYALLLSCSHVSFMGHDCYLGAFKLSLCFQQLARAASLFLAIGYTAFSGSTLATILLTSGAAVGLFWYALVAAVVIHRVYR